MNWREELDQEEVEPPDDIRSLSREKSVIAMSSLFFFLSLSLLTLDQAALISHISFSVGNFLAFESHPCFTMAKSIRASVSKRNRATLRKNFFGPIVDARTERLHAKLQELADKPRPEAPEKSKREQAEDEAGMCIACPSTNTRLQPTDQAAKAQLGGDEGMS